MPPTLSTDTSNTRETPCTSSLHPRHTVYKNAGEVSLFWLLYKTRVHTNHLGTRRVLPLPCSRPDRHVLRAHPDQHQTTHLTSGFLLTTATGAATVLVPRDVPVHRNTLLSILSKRTTTAPRYNSAASRHYSEEKQVQRKLQQAVPRVTPRPLTLPRGEGANVSRDPRACYRMYSFSNATNGSFHAFLILLLALELKKTTPSIRACYYMLVLERKKHRDRTAIVCSRPFSGTRPWYLLLGGNGKAGCSPPPYLLSLDNAVVELLYAKRKMGLTQNEGWERGK